MDSKNKLKFGTKPHDQAWLLEVNQIFSKHHKDSRLRINFIAKKLNLSERQFYRRFKEVSLISPNQYLQEIRLLRGKEMLENSHRASVKEITIAVGYRDVRYFSDIFEKKFGIKPSTLIRKKK